MLGPVPGDRWEKNVYHQLKLQLPTDWIVVANVTWTLSTDGSYVRDGQADFVVLAPGLGMVVVEVKGNARVLDRRGRALVPQGAKRGRCAGARIAAGAGHAKHAPAGRGRAHQGGRAFPGATPT
ncbi:NERD domain-containing protein [Pseudoxanthomonas sp. NC8]|nr:NERD domain-containing protein [Pseudoxanthomonas sp. NC8]